MDCSSDYLGRVFSPHYQLSLVLVEYVDIADECSRLLLHQSDSRDSTTNAEESNVRLISATYNDKESEETMARRITAREQLDLVRRQLSFDDCPVNKSVCSKSTQTHVMGIVSDGYDCKMRMREEMGNAMSSHLSCDSSLLKVTTDCFQKSVDQMTPGHINGGTPGNTLPWRHAESSGNIYQDSEPLRDDRSLHDIGFRSSHKSDPDRLGAMPEKTDVEKWLVNEKSINVTSTRFREKLVNQYERKGVKQLSADDTYQESTEAYRDRLMAKLNYDYSSSTLGNLQTSTDEAKSPGLAALQLNRHQKNSHVIRGRKLKSQGPPYAKCSIIRPKGQAPIEITDKDFLSTNSYGFHANRFEGEDASRINDIDQFQPPFTDEMISPLPIISDDKADVKFLFSKEFSSGKRNSSNPGTPESEDNKSISGDGHGLIIPHYTESGIKILCSTPVGLHPFCESVDELSEITLHSGSLGNVSSVSSSSASHLNLNERDTLGEKSSGFPIDCREKPFSCVSNNRHGYEITGNDATEMCLPVNRDDIIGLLGEAACHLTREQTITSAEINPTQDNQQAADDRTNEELKKSYFEKWRYLIEKKKCLSPTMTSLVKPRGGTERIKLSNKLSLLSPNHSSFENREQEEAQFLQNSWKENSWTFSQPNSYFLPTGTSKGLLKLTLNKWRLELRSLQATRYYQHRLAYRAFLCWRSFIKNSDNDKREHNRKHHLTESKTTIGRLGEIQAYNTRKYFLRWRTLTIMNSIAQKQSRYKYLRRTWTAWRILYVRVSVSKRVANENMKDLMIEIIRRWHCLSSKPDCAYSRDMKTTCL